MFSMIDSFCFCSYLTENGLSILNYFSADHIENRCSLATIANGVKEIIILPLIPYSDGSYMMPLKGGSHLLRHYYFISKKYPNFYVQIQKYFTVIT